MAAVLPFPSALGGGRTERRNLLGRWLVRRTRRSELRRLLATSPHLLQDIGLTPRMAAAEAKKPFWRP